MTSSVTTTRCWSEDRATDPCRRALQDALDQLVACSDLRTVDLAKTCNLSRPVVTRILGRQQFPHKSQAVAIAQAAIEAQVNPPFTVEEVTRRWERAAIERRRSGTAFSQEPQLGMTDVERSAASPRILHFDRTDDFYTAAAREVERAESEIRVTS